MAQPRVTASVATIRHIQRVYGRGLDEKSEEGCQLAWEHICSAIYPKTDITPNGITYSVNRESQRGPLGMPKQYKVDVVVESVRPAGNAPDVGRDILWVECKAMVHDKPSGWKDLLKEAANRLAGAHHGRFVYIIVAVGWKAMLFHWDPNRVGAQALSLMPKHGNTPWPLPIGFAPPGPCRWIDPTTGQVDISQALELCTGPIQFHAPLNTPDINIIEAFMREARAANLQGDNPGHWN